MPHGCEITVIAQKGLKTWRGVWGLCQPYTIIIPRSTFDALSSAWQPHCGAGLQPSCSCPSSSKNNWNQRAHSATWDKDPMVSQSDAIYWYQCWDLACDDEYIRETSRTFDKRYKEHLMDPSPIHHHNKQTNDPINHNNFKIIGREGHHLSRYIKEYIFIRVNNPAVNYNIGKFNLPYIWDSV